MDAEINIIAKRQYNTIILTGMGIAVLFHPVMGTLLITKDIAPILRLLCSDLLMWATLPLLYLYATKVEGRDFFLWKEKVQTIWFYIAAITVLFILAFCAHLIASIPRLLGFHDNYTVMKYWRSILKADKPLLVFTCLTAGFTEELQMRAYILPRLNVLFKSDYLPVLISALIFSLLHIGYGNLSEGIFTFVFGLICALFYKKFQNIQVLIIFHFLYDFLAFQF
jgi:membrane protease YdiL (CAAX protease family)